MNMLTSGTAITLLIFYMVLALVVYHKVFVVFYFDLLHGFMKELFVAFLLAILMVYLTLTQWKIAAVIILIIALVIILKCEDNGKRILIGILAAIAIGFIIYSGLQFSKEVNGNIKESTEKGGADKNGGDENLKRKYIQSTPEPTPELTESASKEEENEIDFAEDENQYEKSDEKEDNEISETKEDEDEVSASEYIFPDSSEKRLKENDVKSLSSAQCRLAKNEIYARHGRLFQDESLQKYFDKKSWYSGYIEPNDFDESVFNKTEKANIKLLAKYENKK